MIILRQGEIGNVQANQGERLRDTEADVPEQVSYRNEAQARFVAHPQGVNCETCNCETFNAFTIDQLN